MRSAFTLVEVLVATAIATVSGAALLQMNTNSTLLFEKIIAKSSISEKLSLFGLHGDIKYNRTTKSLYDILDRRYEIKNDELRKFLKDQSYDYQEKVVETISFDDEPSNETGDESTDQFYNDEEVAPPLIQFEIIQIFVKSKIDKGIIYQVRLVD